MSLRKPHPTCLKVSPPRNPNLLSEIRANTTSPPKDQKSRSRSRTVKRIVKKRDGDATYYEVRMTKYDRRGNLVEDRFQRMDQKPRELEEVRVLEKIRGEEKSTEELLSNV